MKKKSMTAFIAMITKPDVFRISKAMAFTLCNLCETSVNEPFT